MADELFKGFDTPLNLMAADTKRNKVVGQDELGRTIYEAPGGRRYVADTVKAPTSLPETAKAAYDAVPPMEDWRLPTAQEVVDVGKSAIQSAGEEIWNLVSAPTNPDATMGDVIGIVSSMGSPAAVKVLEDVVSQGVDVYDPTTLRMFFGPDSQKADLSALDEAKNLTDKGFSPQEIWTRTGWWNSKNGWRFEISDHDADLHPVLSNAIVKEPIDRGRNVSTKLVDGVVHEDFFDSLPQNSYSESVILDGKVRGSHTSETSGGYNFLSKELGVKGPDEDELRAVLMHELQHVEQTASNAPSQGSSPASIANAIDKTLRVLPREALEYLVTRREIDLLISEVSMRREALKNNVPKGWAATEDPFGVFDQMDLDQFDYTITELKRQRNENKTQFAKAFGADFKKSLDDLYTLTGGFTDLLRDQDGFGQKTPIPLKERSQKIGDMAFDLYSRNVGEAEARLTSARRNLTPVERSVRFPEEDYDVDPNSLLDEYDVSKVLNNVYAEWENTQNRRGYAEGGVVENNRVDPVSGNPVPPGATPKEVRDDVDIKASEGEYIIPANVVRYLGLDKIEKMVNQAKEKLAEMEANGRMGGEKGGEDDLPFGPEELMTTDGEPAQEKPKMAQGGLVTPTAVPNTWNQEIDPVTGKPKWGLFFGEPPAATPAPAAPPVTTASAVDPNAPKPESWADKQSQRTSTPGIAGSVDNWTPRDFVNYNRQKRDPASKVIQGGIATMLPMGGVLVAARNRYLNRQVPEALDKMLSTGKDLQGNPLSERDMAALRNVQKNTEKPRGKDGKERRGLEGFFENVGNKLENLGNKLSGKSNNKSSKPIGQRSSSSSSGDRKVSNPNASRGSSGSVSLSANRSSGSGIVSPRNSGSSNTNKTNSTSKSSSGKSSSSSGSGSSSNRKR